MNITLSIVFSLFSFFAKGNHDPNDLIGKWRTESGKVVTITMDDSIYTGKVLSDEKKVVDLLQGFTFSKDHYDGTLYAAKRDMKLTSSIKMISRDKIEVTIKKGFFTKTLQWNRVKQ